MSIEDTYDIYDSPKHDNLKCFINSIKFSVTSLEASESFQSDFNNEYNKHQLEFTQYFNNYFNYGFIAKNLFNCYSQNLFALLRFLYKLNLPSLPIRNRDNLNSVAIKFNEYIRGLITVKYCATNKDITDEIAKQYNENISNFVVEQKVCNLFDECISIIDYDISNFIIKYYKFHKFILMLQFDTTSIDPCCEINIYEDTFLLVFSFILDLLFNTSNICNDLQKTIIDTIKNVEIPILKDSDLIITQLRKSCYEYKHDDENLVELFKFDDKFIECYPSINKHIWDYDIPTIYKENEKSYIFNQIELVKIKELLNIVLKEYSKESLLDIKNECCLEIKRTGHVAYACYIKNKDENGYDYYLFDDYNTVINMACSKYANGYILRKEPCKYFGGIISKYISSPIYIKLSSIKTIKDYDLYAFKNERKIDKYATDYMYKTFNEKSHVYPYAFYFKGANIIQNNLFKVLLFVILIILIVVIIIKLVKYRYNHNNLHNSHN